MSLREAAELAIEMGDVAERFAVIPRTFMGHPLVVVTDKTGYVAMSPDVIAAIDTILPKDLK